MKKGRRKAAVYFCLCGFHVWEEWHCFYCSSFMWLLLLHVTVPALGAPVWTCWQSDTNDSTVMLSNTPLTHTQTHTVHPQTHGHTLNSLIQGQTAVTRRRCCSQDVTAALSRSLIRICANFLVHKIFVAELQLPGLVMFGFVLRCCDKEEIVKPSAGCPFCLFQTHPAAQPSPQKMLGEQTLEDGGESPA